MPTFRLSRFFAPLLALAAAPALHAAEAYWVIDAGFVTAVDTDTGAVLNSWVISAPASLFGMQFASRDSLFILTGVAYSGDRIYRYAPSGANSWTRVGKVQQPDVTGRLQVGRRMALQQSGMLLALGQNSHDLWEAQNIGWSENPRPQGTVLGKLRSFLPLMFPQEVAASPFGDSYAVWFSNGTLLLNRGGADSTTAGFAGVTGLCYDYTGYPDPVTPSLTRSLLYVANGASVRRYDAATLLPYGKPADRSNPVLLTAADAGLSSVRQIAVDAATGTLFATGVLVTTTFEFVIAGFSTLDGTPRGLGGSTTNPVVYHTALGNTVYQFCLRPPVQVQTYNGGSHTLGSGIRFIHPGQTLKLLNIGSTPASVELLPGIEVKHLEIGGLNGTGGANSNTLSVFSQINLLYSLVSAFISESGLFKVSAGSTVTVTTGTTVHNGGTLEVAAGGTLVCPSGNVTAYDNGVVKGSGIITANSLVSDNGGAIAPGASPGTMTVRGNLELLAGSVLEVEIGGTAAGSAHDQLVVQNATIASLNGRLVPQLTGGFTPAAADTFTVLTSNAVLTGTLQNLSGGRVASANGRNSFALTVINGGTAIQLSDYQHVPPEQAWRNTYFTPAQQTDPLISGDFADPDGDGLQNLLEFTLNSDPLSGIVPTQLPAVGEGAVFTFIRYSGGTVTGANYNFAGVRHVIQSSTDLSGWEPLPPGDPTVTSWTVTPNADGITETVRLTLNGTPRMLRLAVARL